MLRYFEKMNVGLDKILIVSGNSSLSIGPDAGSHLALKTVQKLDLSINEKYLSVDGKYRVNIDVMPDGLYLGNKTILAEYYVNDGIARDVVTDEVVTSLSLCVPTDDGVYLIFTRKL